MRITCPTCDADYEVPDRLIGAAPRRLRCAKCHQEWLADPSPAMTDVPAPPAAAEAGPQGGGDAAPPVPRPADLHIEGQARLPVTAEVPAPSSRAAVVAWGLSLVVLAGLGAAAFHWRVAIMAAWPPSQRVYAMLGLQ